MDCYQRIYQKLKSMCLYRLNGNSFIEAEMKVYSEQLQQLFEQSEKIAKYCFLDEIENPYGYYFERLCHLKETPYPMSASEKAQKQKKIECQKKRLCIHDNSFSKKEILKAIESGGMTAEITEHVNTKKIVVRVIKDQKFMADSTEKKAFIQSLLPVHATAEVQVSVG